MDKRVGTRVDKRVDKRIDILAVATRVLLGRVFNARNLPGGWLTLQAVHPGL